MSRSHSPEDLQRIEDFATKIAERGADDCWLCNRSFSHGELCLVRRTVPGELTIIGKCCLVEIQADPTVRLAERFAGLFAGRDDAHGEVVLERGASKSASDYTVRRTTHHQRLTVELWRRHLDFYAPERFSLGVHPVRPDGTVRFFGFQVDEYPFDLQGLAKRIRGLGLPLIACLGRGGGALVYCFLSDAAPAALAREKAENWAAALGCAGCEVFPRLDANPDDDWAELPYHSGCFSLQYCITADHDGALEAAEILEVAESSQISGAELAAWPTLPPLQVISPAPAPAPSHMTRTAAPHQNSRRRAGSTPELGIENSAVVTETTRPQQPDLTTFAERFHELFAGFSRAYGEAVIDRNARASSAGKIEARCSTIHRPLTVAQWEYHLDPKNPCGIGVFPLRDDGTVRWFALDIDDYNIDHKVLAAQIRDLGVPLIVTRSKSGGAQCYCFLRDDAPASLARKQAAKWAAALGYAGCEIFPKQDHLSPDCPDGNWLNSPYFGGVYSSRYAVTVKGALGAAEFLELAEALRITSADLAGWPVLAPAANRSRPSPAAAVADAPTVEDFDGCEGGGFSGLTEDDLAAGKGDEFWRQLAKGLGKGERHNGIKSLAALLFGMLEPTLAEVLVRLFAKYQCDPPFGERGFERRELRDILRWFVKRELDR